MDCKRVLCATPSYLKVHGVPQTPQDLLGSGHNWLLLGFPTHNVVVGRRLLNDATR